MCGASFSQSPVEQARPADELLDHVVRDHADRLRERLRADLRREPHRPGAIDRHARLAVHVNEAQHVPRIDPVRILDLRVYVPDFGPVPGVLEEHPGDVPEGVALLDDISLRGVRGQRHRHRLARGLRLGRRCRRSRADCQAKASHRQCQGQGADPLCPSGRNVLDDALHTIHPFLHRVSGSRPSPYNPSRHRAAADHVSVGACRWTATLDPKAHSRSLTSSLT